MKRFLALAVGVAMALVLGPGAEAQMRGRHRAPAQVPVSSGARLVRMVPPQTALTRSTRSVVLLSAPGFTPLDSFSGGLFPVPGLGFDFVHLAAVNPNFRATTSPRHITPIIPIGFPFFATPAAPQIILVQQPPVVVLQQPAVQESASEPAGRRSAVELAEDLAPTRMAEPLRDVGEFILVRRDGTLVFAVAFSTAGEQLIYITREGIRRSLPLAELDIENTLRMNEERGTSLRLPV